MNNKSALLIGASGLVGSLCLDLLIKDDYYKKVITLSRKELIVKHNKLEQNIVDFNKLDEYINIIKADDIYCCLGTTVKNAKTKDAYRKVDFEYPYKTAKIALKNAAKQYMIVTAMGANSKSMIFYNRLKGEVEEALSELSFKAVHIFRPSFILGDRKEYRLLEEIAKKIVKILFFVFIGPLKKYKANNASDIARFMIHTAKKNITGVHIHNAENINCFNEI